MAEEPDWTQQDPTHEQVRVWMSKRRSLGVEPLAWAAFQHFARPFHIDVLRKMAAKAVDG